MIQQTGFLPTQAQANAVMNEAAAPLTTQTQTSPNVLSFTEAAKAQPLPQATNQASTSSISQLLESLQSLLQRLQTPAQQTTTTQQDYASELAASTPIFSNMTEGEDLPLLANGRPDIGFSTIVPGEGTGNPRSFFVDGTYNAIAETDDRFLTDNERAGLRAALANSELTDLPFWKNNFENTDEIYDFFIAMGNLESAAGRTEQNEADATGGDNGGSSGLFHLHNMYGFAPFSFGGAILNADTERGFDEDGNAFLKYPLNSTVETPLHQANFEAYVELSMRSLNANYLQSRHTINGESFDAINSDTNLNPVNEQEILASTLGIWWTGDEENSLAGDYYLEALSNFRGVEDNTGVGFTLRMRDELNSGGINDNDKNVVNLPDDYGVYNRVITPEAAARDAEMESETMSAEMQTEAMSAEMQTGRRRERTGTR